VSPKDRTPSITTRARLRVSTFWGSTFDSRNRWIVLACLALLSFVLGFVGLRSMAIEGHGDSSVLTLLYRDLATLSFSTGNAGTGAAIPWTYQVARFLLPVVVIYGAFAGLVMLFRDRFQQVRLPFLRRHTVIVGLGDMGLAFAQAMRASGARVVGIEVDVSAPNLGAAREGGIIVVIGDARERAVLSRARVQRARRVVVSADDATNLEVLVQAQELVAGRNGDALDCLAHSTDPEVCALLKQHAMESARDGRFRVDFFNYDDQAARFLLRAEPPDAAAVIVVGSGALATSVVRHAAALMTTTRSPGSAALLLVAPDATRRIEALAARHPSISLLADLRPVDAGLDPVGLRSTSILLPKDGPGAVVYLCDTRNDVNVAAALALKPAARASGSRVVVCSDHAGGLAILVGEAADSDDVVRIVGLGAEICTRDLVEDGIFELLGRSIHAAYVAERRSDGSLSPADAALVPWSRLPEALKASNRAQAAHIGTKLDAVGCGLVPLEDVDCGWFSFTRAEIELLAEMEHERWVVERRAAGWRLDPERDAKRKTTPYLVGWDELPDDIRDRDRETILRLPAQVNGAGYQIVRLVNGDGDRGLAAPDHV
jgi:hypothetical protein